MNIQDLKFVNFDNNITNDNLSRLYKLIDALVDEHEFSEDNLVNYSEVLFFASQKKWTSAISSAIKALEIKSHYKIQLLLGAILTTFFISGNQSKDLLVTIDQLFSKCINENPSDEKPLFWLGILVKDLDPNLAKDFFERSLLLDKNNAESHIQYSKILMNIDDNIEAALDHFDSALKIDPHYLQAYHETNFYECYLKGSLSIRLKEHINSFPITRRKSLKLKELDKLNIRFLSGITPFIGHYGYLDTFIKLKELGYLQDKQVAILANPNEIVNKSLLNYFSQHISVFTEATAQKMFSDVAQLLEFDYEDIPDYKSKYKGDMWRLAAGIQEEWENKNLPPALKISEEHIRRARKNLESVNIPQDAWFVSLHIRDDGFKGPDNKHALRNSSVTDYMLAVKQITDRGGWVIRMGDPKMTPFPSMPQVFDYARSNIKSDWMDVFLWSQCKFFIGGNSGPSWIPHCFGAPVLRVNWVPITRVPWTSKDLMICKLFKEIKTNRILTFHEMVDPDGKISWTHDTDSIRARGLECIDNTPDELEEATKEMFLNLEGLSTTSTLQKQLEKIVFTVSENSDYGDRTTKFAHSFLSKHNLLLDS